MARHPEGAVLPGLDGARDVARALAQLVAADPLDHDLVVELDLGDVEHRQGLAARHRLRDDLLGVALGGHRGGRPLPLQLVAQVALAATGHGVGPDELVDEEVEDEASHPDERPARSAKQPPHHHLRTAGGQVEVASHPTRFAAVTSRSRSSRPVTATWTWTSSCPRWPGSHAHGPASSSSTRERRSSTVRRPPMRPARLPSLATNQVCGRPVTDQLAATPPRRPCWSYTVG